MSVYAYIGPKSAPVVPSKFSASYIPDSRTQMSHRTMVLFIMKFFMLPRPVVASGSSLFPLCMQSWKTCVYE